MICQHCGRELLIPAEVGELIIEHDICITLTFAETCQDCADLIKSSVLHNLVMILPVIGRSSKQDRPLDEY